MISEYTTEICQSRIKQETAKRKQEQRKKREREKGRDLEKVENKANAILCTNAFVRKINSNTFFL